LQFSHARVIILFRGLPQHLVDYIHGVLSKPIQVVADGFDHIILRKERFHKFLCLLITRLQLFIDLVGEVEQFPAQSFQFCFFIT
jgi:hypothetical protein